MAGAGWAQSMANHLNMAAAWRWHRGVAAATKTGETRQ